VRAVTTKDAVVADRHLVSSERPWWWDPPGLEPDEWAEWLRTVKPLDPHARAHRLASAAASRLFPGTRVVEIRCRVYGTLVAEVRATPRGALWRSLLSGTLTAPHVQQVDLLEFEGCDADLLARCDHDATVRSVTRRRVLEAVDAARHSHYAILDI
jgi:hypothetical protein